METIFFSISLIGMGFMSIVVMASARAWPVERLTEENLLFQIRAWLALTILTVGMGSIKGFTQSDGLMGAIQLILTLGSVAGVVFSLRPQNHKDQMWLSVGISLLAFSFFIGTLVL